MMWLKGCPICRGDLFEEPAIGAHSVAARYITCLQCGHSLTEDQERHLRRLTAAGNALQREGARVA